MRSLNPNPSLYCYLNLLARFMQNKATPLLDKDARAGTGASNLAGDVVMSVG